MRSLHREFKQIGRNVICTRIYKSEEIAFYTHVMHLLGKPANLNFWWGERERVLAISAADASTEMSVSVPDYFYTRKNGPKVKNKKLCQTINRLIGKPDDSNLRLLGEYLPELKIVAFKVGDAEVITNV